MIELLPVHETIARLIVNGCPDDDVFNEARRVHPWLTELHLCLALADLQVAGDDFLVLIAHKGPPQ